MKNGVHVSWNQQAIDHEDVAPSDILGSLTDRQVFVPRSPSAICILVPLRNNWRIRAWNSYPAGRRHCRRRGDPHQKTEPRKAPIFKRLR
jgi:hypothetical protein